MKSGSCDESDRAWAGVNVQASLATWHVPQVRPLVPRSAKKPWVLPVRKPLVEPLPRTPARSTVNCSESEPSSAWAGWKDVPRVIDPAAIKANAIVANGLRIIPSPPHDLAHDLASPFVHDSQGRDGSP